VCPRGSGRLEEALIQYGHALSIDPNYAEAWGNRAGFWAGSAGSITRCSVTPGPQASSLSESSGSTRRSSRKGPVSTRRRGFPTSDSSSWSPRGGQKYGRQVGMARSAVEKLSAFQRATPRRRGLGRLEQEGRRALQTRKSLEAILVSTGGLDRPRSAMPLFNKAIALESLSRGRGHRGLHPVAAGRPDPDGRMVQQGRGLQDQGRFEEALLCFENAVRLDGTSVSAWFGQGKCLRTGPNRAGRHVLRPP